MPRVQACLLTLLAVLVFVVPGAAADDRAYAGFADCNETTGGCIVPDCELVKCDGLPVCGAGLVCFEPHHLGEGPLATVSVSDDLFSPIGAFVCQDLDDDLVCGEPGEPAVTFCGSVTLFLPAWSPADWTYVAIGGVRVSLEACNSPAFGTTGTVRHN